jgi:hypothetical protein
LNDFVQELGIISVEKYANPCPRPHHPSTKLVTQVPK